MTCSNDDTLESVNKQPSERHVDGCGLLVDEMVALSVRGQSFLLQRDFVVGADWVLAKALTSEVPWGRDPNGVLCLDCDPEAFRMVVELLKGTVTEQYCADNLKEIPLLLLATTCDYLCCVDLATSLRSRESHLSLIRSELNSALKKLQDREKEKAAFSDLIEPPNTLFLMITCTSRGSCGRTYLTTAGITEAKCTNCNNCSRSWKVEAVTSFEGLMSAIKEIAEQNKRRKSYPALDKMAATSLLEKMGLPYTIL